jgi:UDP-N-acetylglucosamine 2-epimerase (non-hydrolysing)
MISRKTGKPRIFVVLGTRPEVIKLAPVITALKSRRKYLETIICATGQHRQIVDQMLNGFNIKPDMDLDLMRPDQTLQGFLQNSVAGLNKTIAETAPDMVVVQGDTITAAAAALAAYYARVPVAHVEAGLRSYDRNNPFPEEANRIIVDNVSELLFVPTKTAFRNLERENFPASRIFLTGNTVIDTLKSSLSHITKNLPCCNIPKGKKLVLVTLHRRESFGKALNSILRAIKETVEQNNHLFVVFPVHPNPKVKGPVYAILRHKRIKLIEPLPYLQFLSLMAKSDLIITDSGGVQEEAPTLHKPVLVLRNKTERGEAMFAGGCAKLIGTDYASIIKELKLYTGRRCIRCVSGSNIYGDGQASERIVRVILHYFHPTKFALPRQFENDSYLTNIEIPAQTIFAEQEKADIEEQEEEMIEENV